MPAVDAKLVILQRVLTVWIAACGFGLLVFATPWGIGVSPDSTQYMIAARDLHRPADLLQFPAHWAPGYSLLLAVFDVITGDILSATRLCQCLLFAAFLLTVARFSHYLLPDAGLWTLLPPLLLLSSLQMYDIHYYAWSEGPFVLTMLLSAWWLLKYLEAPHWRTLLVAALFAAACQLMRYAGFAWAATAGLVLLTGAPGSLWRRLAQAMAFGALAVLPLALWLGINALVRNETTDREFAVHLVGVQDLLALLREWFRWFGAQGNLLLGLLSLILVAVVLVRALRGQPAEARLRRFALITAWFALVYTGFIAFSKSFLDAYIPLDARIFAPLYAMLFLLAGLALAQVAMQRRQRPMVLLTLAALLLGNLPALVEMVRYDHDSGRGYLSRSMQAVADVNELEFLEGGTVYSNAPDYLGLVSSLKVQDYPRRFDPTTQRANALYPQEMQNMVESVAASEAWLVHYAGFEGRSYFPDAQELSGMGFTPVISGNGVSVLSLSSGTVPEKGEAQVDE